MVRRLIWTCGVIALSAIPARAEKNVLRIYECVFSVPEAERSYLPEVLAVSYWTWGESALVSDPMVEAAYGAPIEAKLEKGKGPRVNISWTLRLKPPGRRSANSEFRLSIDKASLQAQISSWVMGRYQTDLHLVQGSCRVAKT